MKNKTAISILTVVAIIVVTPYLIFANSDENKIETNAIMAPNLDLIEAVSFKLKKSTSGVSEEAEEAEIVVCNSSKYGSIMNTYIDGKIIMRAYTILKGKSAITIFPQSKMYTRMLLTDGQLNGENSLKELSKLFKSLKHKDLGRKTIKDIEAEGIEVNSPMVGGCAFENATECLWSAVKTGLPVKVEIEGISLGGKKLTKIVIDEFQWNQEIDSSEFEPNIPADCTLYNPTNAFDQDEEATISALRTFAELSDGRYPDSLTPIMLTEGISKVLKKRYQGKPTQEVIDKVITINYASLFYIKLINENKPVEYYGTSVTATDLNAELMKWSISDDEYKVILGDLRIETVNPKQTNLQTAISMGANIPKDKRWVALRILNLEEKDLIKGLSVFVGLSNGQYPSSLNGKTMIKEANDFLRKYGKTPEGDVEKELSNLIFAGAYYDKLVREKKDIKYYGDKISIKDTNAVLVRWKVSDKKYRVVLSDLRTENVSDEELLKLERNQ